MSDSKGLADYFSLYRTIKKEIEGGGTHNKKNIRIAILPSFTINGIKEILFVKCWQSGIYPEIYVAGYNRYAQEILDKDSGLYGFNPEITIIFTDIRTVMGERYLLPYQVSADRRKRWVEETLEEIQSLTHIIKERSSSNILLHNFDLPLCSPLGILENKQEFGFVESVEALNINLRDTFKGDSRVFVFDYNSFCSMLGKKEIVDHKLYYLGDIKLDLQYLPELCDGYLSYIKPMASIVRKCIVLDLDNVLWGGVIGEDGLEGIKLGPTPEGRPFLELQKRLLSFFNRGVILAINSRNNYDDALKAMRDHPYMVLKEEHFVTMQINWDDKVSNMRAIAEEINIGLDSLIYIDDDKLNREIMSDALPEVLVVDLPEDPALYLKTLEEINDLNVLQITEEDRQRGRMYVAHTERRRYKKHFTDITEYLRGLELLVTIQCPNHFNIARISQLTQKTNQFNMTAKRYSEEDIGRFSEDSSVLLFCVDVKDKFGESGITGVAIVKKRDTEWLIDTFLLSCRIIGRKIEDSMLAYIVEKARQAGAERIVGEFISSRKNSAAKNFYRESGFKLEGEEGGRSIWVLTPPYNAKHHEFIKVADGGK